MLANFLSWVKGFFVKEPPAPPVVKVVQQQAPVSLPPIATAIEVAPPEVTKAVKELSVLDFPQDQYTVYWETILTEMPDCWQAEVRFMNYSGGVRETDVYTSPSKDQLLKVLAGNIQIKMNSYKR